MVPITAVLISDSQHTGFGPDAISPYGKSAPTASSHTFLDGRHLVIGIGRTLLVFDCTGLPGCWLTWPEAVEYAVLDLDLPALLFGWVDVINMECRPLGLPRTTKKNAKFRWNSVSYILSASFQSTKTRGTQQRSTLCIPVDAIVGSLSGTANTKDRRSRISLPWESLEECASINWTTKDLVTGAVLGSKYATQCGLCVVENFENEDPLPPVSEHIVYLRQFDSLPSIVKERDCDNAILNSNAFSLPAVRCTAGNRASVKLWNDTELKGSPYRETFTAIFLHQGRQVELVENGLITYVKAHREGGQLIAPPHP